MFLFDSYDTPADFKIVWKYMAREMQKKNWFKNNCQNLDALEVVL